jgi:hypothetical protein
MYRFTMDISQISVIYQLVLGNPTIPNPRP